MGQQEDKAAAKKESRRRSDEVIYIANEIIGYSKSRGVTLAFDLKVDFGREQPWPDGLCHRACAIAIGNKDFPLTFKQAFSVISAADEADEIGLKRSADCDQNIATEALERLDSQGHVKWVGNETK